MSFNGTGTFLRLYNWVNDAAANIKIRADRMDNEMNGFATGLSTCITKNGQTTITANLPMATYRHTGVGNAVNRTDYAAEGQVQDGKLNWVAAGGTADAITASYAIPLTALVDGQLCFVRATAANATTTPTFSPSGLTARTIVKNGGVALVAGDIAGDGHELILRYRVSDTKWELLNPSNASAAILSANNAFTGNNTFAVTSGFNGASTFSALATMNGAAINEAKAANLASATSTDIGAILGNYVHVTGTTTITGLGTIQAGTRRIVEFDDILTLTHNGTSLILPGGVNITTAAGDVATFVSEGSGNWRCTSYTRANGRAVAVGGQEVAKAWVCFNGTGTVAIKSSYNVSSITDNGVGDYTINLTSALADANYAVALATVTSTSGDVNQTAAGIASSDGSTALSKTSSALRIQTRRASSNEDKADISATFYR